MFFFCKNPLLPKKQTFQGRNDGIETLQMLILQKKEEVS